MSTHLSEAKLVDLLDGVRDAAGDEHLSACESCRERLEEARAGLGLARDAEVPEPAPSYWETFPRQVGRRLEERPRPWGRWVWPALATVAAGLVMIALPHRAPVVTPTAQVLPAWTPLPPVAQDPSLEIVESVAAHLEPEAECGGLDDCVAQLSDEEGGSLAVLVQSEARRRPS